MLHKTQPSSKFPIASVVAPPVIRQMRPISYRPEEDNPIGLYGVARPISVGCLPHYLPCIHRRHLSPLARGFSSETSAEPSCKKYDSVEGALDNGVFEDIEADLNDSDEVAVDRDVVTGIDVGIGMEVDVWFDVEDEVESSDRGTMKVGVDVVARIDILDAMLLPDVVERLEQVEKGLQDIYDHMVLEEEDRLRNFHWSVSPITSKGNVIAAVTYKTARSVSNLLTTNGPKDEGISSGKMLKTKEGWMVNQSRTTVRLATTIQKATC
ncbi:hypothetical protein Tco_0146501 [Tanacetum coccineum]